MDFNDLTSNIRDFFMSQYKDCINNTPSFIAFEPLGHNISPDDFKFNGEFNQTVASEQLSIIADVVPAVSDTFVPNGFNSVSDAYGNLLESIQFCDKNISGDVSPYMSLLGGIKNKAKQDYQSQASIQNASQQVFVCNGNPNGWYDKESSIWQHKSFSSTSTSTQESNAGPVKPLMWKLNSNPNLLQQSKSIINILNKPLVINRLKMVNPNLIMARPVAASSQGNTATDQPQAKPLIARAQPLMASGLLINRKPIEETAGPQNDTNTDEDRPQAPLGISPAALRLNRTDYRAINTALPLDQMVLLNRTIGQDDNTQTEDVKSTDFKMDFDYTLVYLDRPWMDAQLFDEAKLWYAAAQRSGYYSTGDNSSANNGILRAVPKSMIVIKNLTIAAQWSEQDKQAASSAYGLGYFNISDSSLSNNTLTAPGIQIIGWVCEVLPEMPVNDDPNVS